MNGGNGGTTELLRTGDELRRAGRVDDAIAVYEQAARITEIPCADACLKLARCLLDRGESAGAARSLRRIVDASEHFAHWQASASLLAKIDTGTLPDCKRTARVAVLGSYTTTQYVPMLRLAGLRFGVAIDTYECAFGQYRQEILNPVSGLYAFQPDIIVIATHAGELALPGFAHDASHAIEEELSRWTSLWSAISSRTAARVIQHNFVRPLENPFGHLSTHLAGSRQSLIGALNVELARTAAGDEGRGNVSMLDCDALASRLGKQRWFDDRYWHLAKQAVSLEVLPVLAKHTTAVIAASMGLTKKCLVLDLDNTLWGGVIGEDGLAGIKLGAGVEGEAFVAFQRLIKSLGERGVILAVCSKNNEADALAPFESHPDMALKHDDFAMFVANWRPKPENLRSIARTLNIGVDSLVFVDDNPAEREVVRQQLPQVDVITLPADPTGYVRALGDYLGFETISFTAEDASKTMQYRARAEAASLQANAASLEEYYASLEMTAEVRPLDEMHLPRIEQLIGKTNQFNLTTRRHGMQQLRRFVHDPNCVHLYLKLRDRFADHGLVALMIAIRRGDALEIDTWLMSCRVIGRTVENAMLHELCLAAQARGCRVIRGTYIPTAKNEMVRDVFGRYGFEMIGRAEDGQTTLWEYDLARLGPVVNDYIALDNALEHAAHDAA